MLVISFGVSITELINSNFSFNVVENAPMRNFALLDSGINRRLTDAENGGNLFHGVKFFQYAHSFLGDNKNCGYENGILLTAGKFCSHH